MVEKKQQQDKPPATAPEGPQSKAKPRSPGYPAIDLKAALDKAALIYKAEGRLEADEQTVFKHMGYKGRSGISAGVLAALKAFGLLETAKGNGKLKLSSLALRILLDQREDETEKRAAIREAALKPAMHQHMREQFKGGLPSESNMLYHLTMEKGFTESGAKQFVAQYKDTVAFAGLAGDATISDGGVDQGGDSGDSSGKQKFDFAGLEFLGLSGRPNPKPPAGRPGMNHDVFTLDEGQVVLQWPAKLSPESYEDMKDWLELMARKVKRAVQVKEGESVTVAVADTPDKQE